MSIETLEGPSREVSATLAAFVADLTFDDLPPGGVRLAERCVLDTVGVTLAGSTEGAGAVAARFTGRLGDGGPARLLGREATASLTDAAFVNGTAGHGLDFDDVTTTINGHPSVTMVPALLAVGEAIDASGRDLITAFVAGFEAQAYLGGLLMPGHYEIGWHSTATFGTFGATAAVASLLDLDETETRHALNAAASMPAGLIRNFGSMTKPMHVGRAARSGVTAGLLAAEGHTADAAAIGGDRGFLERYAGPDGVDHDAVFDLGERWAIVEEGVHVKKYPCCYFTHTSIAAAEDLVDEHDIAPDSIESVHVTASRGAKDVLVHENPRTGLEGKFSMQYTVASGIVRDRTGLAAFDDGELDDPVVQQVRDRISFEADPDIGYESFEATVTIEPTGGQPVSMTLEEPPGTHSNPLSDAELREKFRGCARRALDDAAVEQAITKLDGLRTVDAVADIMGGL